MTFSEIIVFGVIWGALMLYFLTPFKSKRLQNKKDQSFKSAFWESLRSGITHKKVILAFVMLSSTLAYIWQYYVQLEWHIAAHGGSEMTFNPTTKAIYTVVGIIIYAVILYLLSALKRAKASSLR